MFRIKTGQAKRSKDHPCFKPNEFSSSYPEVLLLRDWWL